MDDNYTINIKLCNDEEEFIYKVGVNKGSKSFPQKLDRCLFLSCSAKALYHNISHYAYGEKNSCFPTQKQLMFELGGVSNTTIIKLTDELEKAGFIKCQVNNKGRNLIYYISKLCNVPILYHSEIVHSIILDIDIPTSKIHEYMKSDLYEKVASSTNPTEYIDEIKTWFNSSQNSDEPEVVEDSSESADSILKKRQELAKAGIGIPQNEVVLTKPQGKKTKKTTNSDDPNTWHSGDFIFYFQAKYLKKYHSGAIITAAEMGAMKRVITAKQNNIKIKEQMDIYIENNEKVFQVISILDFTSSKVQSILDAYTLNGKYPSYLIKKATLKENTSNPNSPDDDYAWCTPGAPGYVLRDFDGNPIIDDSGENK